MQLLGAATGPGQGSESAGKKRGLTETATPSAANGEEAVENLDDLLAQAKKAKLDT